MTAYFRNYLIVLVLAIVAVVIYNIMTIEKKPPAIDYTSFLYSLENQEIKSVLVRGGEITGLDKFDKPFYTFAPPTRTAARGPTSTIISATSSKCSG